MTNTYNRRQFLTHSAATAGGVVAGGMLVDALAGAQPAGAVTKGGTLTVGLISAQNAPFNPTYGNLDTSGFMIARAIYDPLCVVSADGKTVYPYLCQSLTHDGTYKNWTVTARPGVKFHNGDPCNGDAIYANMLAVYNSALTGAAVKSVIAGFTHKAGSNTVTIHTKYKWVTFPYTLAEQQIAFIAHPSTLGAGYKGNPIGTGPFIANSAIGGQNTFTVTANPQYWQKGLPYLSAVAFVVQPDSPTRLQLLQNGNADLIIMSDAQYVKQMKSLGAGYNVKADFPGTPVYSPSSNCIMLNCKNPPFNNLNMRKGCAYAINRAQFVSVVSSGESSPIDGIYLPGSPYYKKPAYPAYNVATAKSYINKVPSGQRSFTLTYVAGDPTILQAAEFIQSELGVVGVNVTLSGVSQGKLIGDAIGGTFEALTWAQFGGVSPDLNYPWFSTKTLGLFGLNFAHNNDPKIQSLMVAGFGATTASARYSDWGKVNDQLALDVPYLWTDRAVLAVGARSSVQNWETYSYGGKAVLQPNQNVLFLTTTWK